MRRPVSAFLALVMCFLIFKHYFGGLGIRSAIRSSVAMRVIDETDRRIADWVAPDTLPPTAPQNLRGGPAPIVQRVEGYLNRTLLKEHTTASFDSTGGDSIVACASSHAGVMMTPSDSLHNTWIAATGPTNSTAGFDLRSQIWYAKNPTVGPAHTFTLTLSVEQPLVISIFVIRGANAADPIDAVSTIGDNAGTQSLAVSSPSILTANNNDLLIGFGKSSVSETWKPGSGFALQRSASSHFLVAESGLAAAPGKYSATFLVSTAATWESAVVAVRPSPTPAKSMPITLSWNASSDNVGVASYEVERCQGAACNDFAPIGATSDPAFVDSTLRSPKVYRYRVRAMDAALNASDYSNAITATASNSDD